VTYRIERMTAESAAAIGRWRYPPPYDTYDLEPGDVEHMLNPRYRYHTLWDGEALIGYCCFGEDARVPGGAYADDALDVGWGMHPGLMGLGRGHGFVGAITAFARASYRPPTMRVTVADFNARSRRVAEHAGFSLERERFQTKAGERFTVLVTPSDRDETATSEPRRP
jgi:RimJ/RimL family protein N-acetyltransferase